MTSCRKNQSLRTALAISISALFLLLASSGLLSAQRLPDTVSPTHYALTLAPDLQAATFTGIETIDVTLAEPSRTITLNALDISFQSVKVSSAGREQTASVSLDKNKQQATFTFPDALPAGPATLSIAYTGILGNNLRGFYLSKTDRRNYAVTQFESTDARRAFPSFDEPALKAAYDISLVVDNGDTAISNGPVISDTPGPAAGKHTLRFATTPRMSTYLVAFLVGDFQCTSGESDGVAIRACATPDKVALTPYSLSVAKWMLHYYNDYFGIPYPLKKLDLIALPDFEAGAMENFGAITYRETDLLLDENASSTSSRTLVAEVVAHEMAHQWFGDLVTMQWWNNIWLNEGFATWMESKATAEMHPDWNIDQQAIADREETLDLDALPTTRPIRAQAETPDEINQLFDGIAYGKAGAVLSSIENYVGKETFRQGVQRYLSAHLYANATAEDFWNAQTAVSHKPVDKIMQSLVAQPGVPVLTFGKPAQGKVSVTQHRFFLNPDLRSDASQEWTLPVCFKTDTGQDCQLLTPSSTGINPPQSALFFANAGGKGYYRTSYSPADYAAVLAKIESALTPAERISFLGDEWAHVRSNRASVGDVLNLAAAVKDDPSAQVFNTALGTIDAIYFNAATTAEQKAALSAWIRANFTDRYAALAQTSAADTDNANNLRANLFLLLGYYGKDPAVLAKARQIALKFMTDPASADATMGQYAVRITAANGDAPFFDQLQKVYESSTDPQIRDCALRALVQFEDPDLVERALEYAISSKVRNQDTAVILSHALANDAIRDLAWKFIQSHWEKVRAQLTISSGSEVVAATGNFCSAAAHDDIKNFFATHKVAASEAALRHALENIDGCVKFRSLQEPKLRQWLSVQQGIGSKE
jgi:aminopeptidase N/puromycin-sensitive aminopeptidase